MMNSSSKTSTTLKSSRVSNGLPPFRLSQSKISVCVLFIFSLILLIKLGSWQLNRGYEKQRYEQRLQITQNQAALTQQEFIKTSDFDSLPGRRLSIEVTPTSKPLLALDNQVYQGRAGYLVFQLTAVAPDSPLLLIELGFAPANPDRTQLPQVLPLTNKRRLQGRLYHRLRNPVSHRLFAEPGSPTRIQNLNIPELSRLIQNPVFPVVFQPEAVSFDQQRRPLAKPWNPLPMPAKKHFGYAMQWFSMALGLLIIGLILIRRNLTCFSSILSMKRSKDEFSRPKK